MFNNFFIFGFVFCLVVILTCGDDKSPTTPEDTVKEDPSFSADIQPIFNKSCTTSGCHDVTAASANLNLQAGQAYVNLTNVNSTQDGTKKRVLPGDAENSYLVIKIEGRQAPGTSQMPLGGSPLSNTSIQLIKNWIDKGAKNN